MSYLCLKHYFTNMRHRLSILLMALSLVLLAGFLFLFLKKTYEDERETLKRETGYLFINAIRGIEGDVLEKLVFHKIKGEADSLNQFTFSNGNPLQRDSLKIITFIGEKDVRMEQESLQFKLRATTGKTGDAEMFGSLSVVVAMGDEHKKVDTLIDRRIKRDIMPLLEKNFSEAFAAAELPVCHRIVRLENDSSQNSSALIAGHYTDLASGKRFGAELSGYTGYLVRQMMPQILFSGGLFGCVALAFFTIFQNLKTQQRLTELKNDFIRNVTHELKTPIATVGVAIEALQDFEGLKNPERTREYLDISRMELNRLSLLVDKVLRMSLFEKTEPDLQPEQLDLKTLVAGILASMKLQFEKCMAQVRFEAGEGNFNFRGDRLHLASVVYNLLDNALKYSPKDPEILVELTKENGSIILKISDRGIGIPPAYKDKVFEKFFRIPTGDVHNVKGHGLGLSYVASVVEKHGGSVSVEQREGGGTAFRISLKQRSDNETH
jgi:signal transduction histidine kinase